MRKICELHAIESRQSDGELQHSLFGSGLNELNQCICRLATIVARRFR
jgi:hypothetical protein